jgi:hypothetical protein
VPQFRLSSSLDSPEVNPLDWLSDHEDIFAEISDGKRLQTLLTHAKRTVNINPAELKDATLGKIFTSLGNAGLLNQESNHQWSMPGATKVQIALRAIQLGQPQREILDLLSWQEFEEYVAQIFSFHDFQIHHRYRFKAIRRFEIDIVAQRKPFLFCVDCKQYGIRQGKTASLRSAVDKQLFRVQHLAESFPIHQSKLKLLVWNKTLIIPLLVTMLHEELIYHENIPVVPASQINTFLLNFEKNLDWIRMVKPGTSRQTILSPD